MKKVNVVAIAIVAVVIALVGNVLFIIESFHPMGDIMHSLFGTVGDFLGLLIGIITFCVDIAIVAYGICFLIDYLAKK